MLPGKPVAWLFSVCRSLPFVLRGASSILIQWDMLEQGIACRSVVSYCRTVADLHREFAQSRLDFLTYLAKAAESRDNEAGTHNCRVGFYSRAIAEALGMPPEFVELISLASPLHDIGKIGIPDSILLKPGALTQDERRVMQQHCVYGYRILRPDICADLATTARIDPVPPKPLLDMAADIALMHHERPDGGGYPRGLSGSSIPIESSIVALADVYDALRSPRPYKPPYSEAQSLEIMRTGAGTQFDISAYAGFESALGTIRDIHAELSGDEPAPKLTSL